MHITYLGHYCFLLEINGKKILFDPFILSNEKNEITDISDIECDFILLTHGHSDHCEDVLEIYKNNQCELMASFEVCSWFQNQGVKNFHPMNIGGEIRREFGTIKSVNAVHSSTMPDGSYGGLAGGFFIGTQEMSLYFSGDTALTYDMKLISEYWSGADISILPIGDNFTMGVEDAFIASEFVNSKNIIGAHYDTFGYIEIDHEMSIQYFSKRNKNLHLLPIGEKISISSLIK